MRAIVLAAALAACNTNHRVDLLLGPNAQTPSIGYECKDANGVTPLLARGFANGQLTVQIVIDLIDLGGHYPSCLGDDIVATCANLTCGPTIADAPQRFCKTMSIPISAGASQAEIIAAIDAWLHDNAHVVTADAPHSPVIVRAVATLQSCAELDQTVGTLWKSLDKTMALGCAYSCPVQLDAVDGPISLGLDVLSTDNAVCVPVMQGCAAFPGM